MIFNMMVQMCNLHLTAEFVVFRANNIHNKLPIGFLKMLGFVQWRMTPESDKCWASVHEIIQRHLHSSKPAVPKSQVTSKQAKKNEEKAVTSLSIPNTKSPKSNQVKSQNLMIDFYSPKLDA